ncbi:hypothetical protein I4U23_001440 [Adineta vaga]|nr:hypothetical protein I4U23_001440 [Adineta vaga]
MILGIIRIAIFFGGGSSTPSDGYISTSIASQIQSTPAPLLLSTQTKIAFITIGLHPLYQH